MKLDELLSKIITTAKDNNINQPFMVGGVPRDRIIGLREKKSNIKDIDITTGDTDSLLLSELVHKNIPGSVYRTYDDGHASIDFMGLHIDFASHFIIPGIEKELVKMGISDIDSMKKEIYSRDFTINTLLESLDFTAIYDITGESISDIAAGLIKCPIDPNITIGVDPRRIIRAIKFSVKYDFKISDDLKAAIRTHREKIKNLPLKFVQEKFNEIVFLDSEKGLDALLEYKLLPIVPLTKTISDLLIQKRKLIRAL